MTLSVSLHIIFLEESKRQSIILKVGTRVSSKQGNLTKTGRPQHGSYDMAQKRTNKIVEGLPTTIFTTSPNDYSKV